VLSSTLGDLIRYLAPSAIGSMLFMAKFANKRNIPIMTDVTQLLSSVVIVTTVAAGLVRPWGRPFKVTDKGVHATRTVVRWRLMFPFAAMAGATVLGILRNASSFSPLYGTDGYAVNVFWSLFNIAVLVLACAICVEAPPRRLTERFRSHERATLRLANGMQVPCEVNDVSLGGARLALGIGSLRADDAGVLTFADGVEAPCALVRTLPGGAAVRFADDAATRRALIKKLFTGAYDNDIREIRLTRVAAAIAHRLAA
jgi:cellulose synthase (UDP-forming)